MINSSKSLRNSEVFASEFLTRFFYFSYLIFVFTLNLILKQDLHYIVKSMWFKSLKFELYHCICTFHIINHPYSLFFTYVLASNIINDSLIDLNLGISSNSINDFFRTVFSGRQELKLNCIPLRTSIVYIVIFT